MPFGSTQWDTGQNMGMRLSRHRCGTGRIREGSLFLRNLLVCRTEKAKEREEAGGWAGPPGAGLQRGTPRII